MPYSTTLLRMCVVGDVAVGKTSLTARFMNGTFCDMYKPTCLVSYFHKLVQTPDRNVFLQIWDTAGQERHRSLSPHIVRDSRSAMLVYDVTNRTSYEEVKRYWLGWIAEHAPPGIRLTLVGNKSDLDARSNLRQVSRKEAKRYAEANGMLFYETSAKTGKNVDVAFLDGGSFPMLKRTRTKSTRKPTHLAKSVL
ncbi:hypothetical protein BaRGS_00010512 [Batillaria attramentaria]|uniref:Uncharacterized protein n=1 Tax=Batillaria attramentaria TaxID=370345 RepID=A0ABD0LGS1_9CAEN